MQECTASGEDRSDRCENNLALPSPPRRQLPILMSSIFYQSRNRCFQIFEAVLTRETEAGSDVVNLVTVAAQFLPRICKTPDINLIGEAELPS